MKNGQFEFIVLRLGGNRTKELSGSISCGKTVFLEMYYSLKTFSYNVHPAVL